MTTSKTPAGLKASGSALWRAVLDEYEIDKHEELLLLQACRTADHLDELAKAAEDAPLLTNWKGDPVANPALTEHRQKSLTLARLLASLRLPSGEDEEMNRPQRRGAARASYGLRKIK